jgi:uncharacterized repeat protein (TIGR02543 family)
MATAATGWSCTHGAYVVSETNTTATIRVTAYWQNVGWKYNINHVSAWVYCNGSSYQVMNGGSVNTTSGTSAYASLGYHDFTINKGTASQSISCYASITSSSSYASGTKWATASSVSVAAKPSYTVKYNANGGTGAPGNQTKWYGTNLTLSSTKPTKTGHNFVRWNTNTSNTGTAYSPGGTYTGNAALTLYAIWTPHTYTVSYNANGGTGAPGNQTKTYGVNLTLSSTKPTRTNYNFKGWSTSASGSVVYAAGATYTNNSAVTLYAVWELAYTKPRITSFTAQRCTSDGTASETGTYIKATFNWATDYETPTIAIQYKSQGASDWTREWGNNNTGKSGSISQIVGAGEISIETSYKVRVYVSDSGGTTYSSELPIGTVKFPIDVKAGGTGVAIGKVAESSDLFDVNLPTKYRSSVNIDGTITVKDKPLLVGTNGLAQRFTVGGEADVYYPVLFRRQQVNGLCDGFPYGKMSLSRFYAWEAPNTWNTSTHRGGLTFSWYWTGDSCWGGNDHSLKVLRFHEQYCKMVGGIQGTTNGVIVWLRGGGARYQFESDYGLGIYITVCLTGYTDERPVTFSPISYDRNKVITQILKQKVSPGIASLYTNSSGSNGTINLSDGAYGFEYLEIFYKDNSNFFNSTRVYNPSANPKADLTVTWSNSTNTYTKTKPMYIYNDKIVGMDVNHYTQIRFGTDGVSYLSAANNIYVVKVLGYRSMPDDQA